MRKLYKIKLFVLLLLLTGVLTTQGQTSTRFVDLEATVGAQDGSSWEDAFLDVQSAIDASASGDHVFVKGGLYILAAPIIMKEGVKIYGSFAGDEASVSDRLDIFSTSSPSILEGGMLIEHVIYNNQNSLTPEASLDGFVITGGKATGSVTESKVGAGIYLNGSSPTLQNLVIYKNSASSTGGGIWMNDCSPVLSNLSITENSGLDGGGVAMDEAVHAIMTNVTIRGNTATRNGGGVAMRRGSNPVMTNVLIVGNTANSSGGGLIIDSFHSKPNQAEGSKPVLTNVTISGNYGMNGGAAYIRGAKTAPEFRNAIVLGNNGPGGNVFVGPNVANVLSSFSLIEDKPAEGDNLDGTDIVADVVFQQSQQADKNSPALGGNYQLKPDLSNPVINAGSSAFFAEGLTPDISSVASDLLSNSRIYGSSIDLGAYEVQNRAPIASNLAIQGDLTVGGLLEGTYDWEDYDGDAEGASVYQWYRANDSNDAGLTAIAGASSLNYTVQEADRGKYLQFEVIPHDGKDAGERQRTALVKINSVPEVSAVAIVSATGDFELGAELTGTYMFSDADGDEDLSSYKWLIADTSNPAAEDVVELEEETETYLVREADEGKYIAFRVVPNDGLTTGEAMMSAWVKINTAPAVSGVAITGLSQVGEILQGTYNFEDADGDEEDPSASVYTWYLAEDDQGTGAAAIVGEESLNYSVKETDQGKFIAFEIIPGDGTSSGEAVRSAWQKILEPVVGNNPPMASEVIINGELVTGQSLSGDYEWTDSDAGDMQTASTYKWFHADDDTGLNAMTIDGATSAIYDLQEDDFGKYIKFEVIPSDGKSYGNPSSSAWVGPVLGDAMISFATETVNKSYGDEDFSMVASSNSPAELAYSSDNENVATVNDMGLIQILGVGTANIMASQDADATWAAANAKFELNVSQKTLSVTVAGGKTYDGKADVSVEDFSFGLIGAIEGEDVTLNSASASGLFVDENVGMGKMVSITGLSLEGSEKDNYILANSVVEAEADILPKSLDVEVTGTITKSYDGDASAAVQGLTFKLVGVLEGEQVSLSNASVSGVYVDKNVDVEKTVTLSGLSLEGPDMSNYALASVPVEAEGDITPKELSVAVAGTISKVYNGDVDVSLEGLAYELSGVIDADNVSLNTSAVSGAFPGKDAATGQVVNISGLSLSGDDNQNYVLAPVEASGDILAKELTVTVIDATKNKGEDDPAFSVSFDGFVEGETESDLGGTLNITRAEGEDPGFYTVSAAGYTSVNYMITYANGNLEIVGDGETGEEQLALKAENFFTPNGDGINDNWVVEDVDEFPSHSLLIIDRGGRTVYQTKDYRNEWTGTVAGTALQEGTYYYIFSFDDPKIAPKKGFITILKQ